MKGALTERDRNTSGTAENELIPNIRRNVHIAEETIEVRPQVDGARGTERRFEGNQELGLVHDVDGHQQNRNTSQRSIRGTGIDDLTADEMKQFVVEGSADKRENPRVQGHEHEQTTHEASENGTTTSGGEDLAKNTAGRVVRHHRSNRQHRQKP